MRFLLTSLLACAVAHGEPADLTAHVLAHREGRAPYSIDFSAFGGDRSPLPIGVFDSGIGGLTVLEAILKLDAFQNQTLQPGPDGVPDFAGEKFVYFGDQANMPYGNYSAHQRGPFLRELILKDAVFLLGTRFRPAAAAEPSHTKPAVKAIVIACNTATAYGLEDIRTALRAWQLDVPVIGVVEAGARAVAAELRDEDSPRSVAVLATLGTCASQAYPKAIGRAVGMSGKRVPPVVQQGSIGLAGAIEGNQAFIAKSGAGAEYQGPPLEAALLPAYGFDPAGMAGDAAAPRLASVRNYARYDVTTLLHRSAPPAGAPIGIVVLGCTHFPMAQGELAEAFERARAYQSPDGARPFAVAVAETLRFVDPAQATAKELFRELARARLRSKQPGAAMPVQFYLSVPNPNAPGVRLASDGSLESAYKYSRDAGRFEMEDTVAIPMTPASLPAVVLPLVRSLPAVWQRLGSN